MNSEKSIEIVKARWKKKKAMLLEELVQLMSCSAITVRRRLKKWNSISSYNKNGRYYTLPDIAKFNDNGLWNYRGIGFSINGNLIQTITHLVCSSSAGLYGEDISGFLHLDSYSILARIMKRSCLRREKMFGKFIYFASDKKIYSRQLQARIKIKESHSLKNISDSVGVIALVEFINNPELGLLEISRQLNRQGVNITEELLNNFFKYHGILKKTRGFRQ